MGFMNKRKSQRVLVPVTQTAPARPFGILDGYVPLSTPQTKLYYALREAVPVIDAAIFKLVRLTGGFNVKCGDASAQRELERFMRSINVGEIGRAHV